MKFIKNLWSRLHAWRNPTCRIDSTADDAGIDSMVKYWKSNYPVIMFLSHRLGMDRKIKVLGMLEPIVEFAAGSASAFLDLLKAVAELMYGIVGIVFHVVVWLLVIFVWIPARWLFHAGFGKIIDTMLADYRTAGEILHPRGQWPRRNPNNKREPVNCWSVTFVSGRDGHAAISFSDASWTTWERANLGSRMEFQKWWQNRCALQLPVLSNGDVDNNAKRISITICND